MVGLGPIIAVVVCGNKARAAASTSGISLLSFLPLLLDCGGSWSVAAAVSSDTNGTGGRASSSTKRLFLPKLYAFPLSGRFV